jgi:hypothetical protein
MLGDLVNKLYMKDNEMKKLTIGATVGLTIGCLLRGDPSIKDSLYDIYSVDNPLMLAKHTNLSEKII